MTTNYREFAAEIDVFTDREVPEAVQELTQKVGLQALAGVVRKTPVDTGRARGNWQATLDSPAEREVERLDPDGGQTISEGAVTLAQVEPFGSAWLSNNVPYIEALENGHSQQAPNGMVDVTVAEILSQFRRVE